MSAHNFCIDCGDQPESIPWFDVRDMEVNEAVAFGREHMDLEDVVADLLDEEEDVEAMTLKAQGYCLREEIFNHLFPPP